MEKKAGNIILLGILVILIALYTPIQNVFAFDPNSPGKLEAFVVASGSPDYIYEWISTPYKHDICIKPIKAVAPSQMFHMAVLVTGYEVNAEGKTDLIGDFILQNPDGSIQFHEKDAYAYKKTAKNLTGFIMLYPPIDIEFDEKDQTGEYVIRAIVKDNTLNKTVTAEYKIGLYDDSSVEEAMKFVPHYYKNPQPEKLRAVLKVFLAFDELITDTVHFGPIMHFFAILARDNLSFMNELKDLMEDYSGMRRDIINEIIHKAEKFVSPQPNTAKNLDYLWVEFCATGSEEPVKKIISVLSYPDKGMNIVLIGVAEWSLASNARQHEKVYEIIKKESLSATGKLKEKIDQILKKAAPAKKIR